MFSPFIIYYPLRCEPLKLKTIFSSVLIVFLTESALLNIVTYKIILFFLVFINQSYLLTILILMLKSYSMQWHLAIMQKGTHIRIHRTKVHSFNTVKLFICVFLSDLLFTSNDVKAYKTYRASTDVLVVSCKKINNKKQVKS